MSNHKEINQANYALEAAMNCVPPIHEQGEQIFLSLEAHKIRTRLDAIDDDLREKQIKLTNIALFTEDPQARHKAIIELEDVIRQRDKIETTDDAIHAKDGYYKQSTQKYNNKMQQLMTQACSILDRFVNYITELFTKKKAVS